MSSYYESNKLNPPSPECPAVGEVSSYRPSRLFTALSAAVTSSHPGDPSSLLEGLLSLDAYLTRRLALCASSNSSLHQKILRYLCYALELSGHGVPWFSLCGLLAILYIPTGSHVLFSYLVHLLFLLVADIIVVAPIKLYFQRPRPSFNKGSIPLSISSVDQYAFPSGHTSRCVALAALFCYMSPFIRLWSGLTILWAVSVSFSRIVIGRHHIFDVIAGAMAGVVVFELTKFSIQMVF
ncbi:PREDICTED: phospholipid phosphatase 6-like [Amphimedon queenslandica]|uniref:Phosphatidic acid phosphatase type 2/haloperoxidase domain-containing protein n=1 Tax=Amphimedon queenslandica TaxID=400682 RepID=A0A1X7UQP1_AMPQE|nr:PREDICTED: phospholipid phosphatase 6-like [Amphimedon queenslandica]|eukprot:XP_011404296.1 PREDICTED: phospholipid phosphatase 6-like [Amphimedon queenslandica]